MTDLIYTPEFYQALEQMVDHRPHKCRQCGVSDGTRKLNKDGSKQNFERIVRLCLIDPHQPSNDASNIAFFCTRCRKAPFEWRTPRRIKPGKLPQLFKKEEELKGPRIVNGHLLKECHCNLDSCPICSWGAGICSLCNAAEIELEQPCKKELSLLEKVRLAARNKVPSKPPQVYDEDIPF